MKIFFKKDLKEIQKEKIDTNFIKQIQDLKNENEVLKEELLLTQEAVNELLFADMEVE